MIGTENNYYPGFELPASALSAFAFSVDTFVISLKNGGMARFRPKDAEDFKKWLAKHHVRDIAVDNGIPKQPKDILSRKKN